MKFRHALAIAVLAAAIAPAMADGLGESRPWQFRTDNERQSRLSVDRTRLELLGLLGSSSGLGSGGTGQTGNALSINVSGSGNTISVTQSNTGSQTQTSDCSNGTFSVTGGMYGC